MYIIAPPYVHYLYSAISASPHNCRTTPSNMARILRAKRIAIAAADGPVIAALVLAIVGAIALVPRLGVVLALRPLRNVVLGEHECVEKIASIVGAIVVDNVFFVKLSLGLASSGALARIVGTRVEAGANVAGRCNDRAAELGGTGERRVRWWRRVLGVAVGAGNDDVKLALVLAGIGGLVGTDC